MQVHIIAKLARQVEGELVFVNAIAGFLDKAKADEFLKNYRYKPAEVIQGYECIVEVGILYDLEVE